MTREQALENFSHDRAYYCPKCNVEMSSDLVYKRLWRGSDRVNCPSCEARPMVRVIKDGVSCTPWHGDFDDDDNPMLNGELHMAGPRSCNHRDCVNPKHVITAEALIAEQHSISYRTGKSLTYAQLVKQLKKERFAS